MVAARPLTGRIRAPRHQLSGEHLHAADAGSVVHDYGRPVGSCLVLPRHVALARSVGGRGHVDRHRGRRSNSSLPPIHRGHLESAAGRDAVRLCDGLADRHSDTSPVPRHRVLGDREGVEEVIPRRQR